MTDPIPQDVSRAVRAWLDDKQVCVIEFDVASKPEEESSESELADEDVMTGARV